MANFCSECGAAIVGSGNFCAECGHRVTDNGASAAPEDESLPKRDVASGEGSDPTENLEANDEEEDGPSGLGESLRMAQMIASATMSMAGDKSASDLLADFFRRQGEPRGPMLKSTDDSYFLPTGRDVAAAEEFEALLDRTGVAMGPAGMEAAEDRSLWDFYNGIWDIDLGCAIFIDAHFGRSRINGNTSVLLTTDVLVGDPVGAVRWDEAWMSDTARELWDDVAALAEIQGPGLTIDPLGILGLSYFGRFDYEERPVRGIRMRNAEFVRLHTTMNRRAIGDFSSAQPLVQIWYMIDQPLYESDDLFLETTSVLCRIGSGMLRVAQERESSEFRGMYSVPAMATDPEAVQGAGVVTDLTWV